MTTRSQRIALLTVFLLLATIAAQAQWVAVAHAVSGRIQQMQQKNANGPGGYDVATVVIEANAQKVYETALQRLQAHSAEVKVDRGERQKAHGRVHRWDANCQPSGKSPGRQAHPISRRLHSRPSRTQRDFSGGQEHSKRLRRTESRVHAAKLTS